MPRYPRKRAIEYAAELTDVLRHQQRQQRRAAPGTDPNADSGGAQLLPALDALFLGTRAENGPFLTYLLGQAVEAHAQFRRQFHPEDPSYLSAARQQQPDYVGTLRGIEAEYKSLLAKLQDSGPFFSPRSVGHMLWDTSLPGVLGYFAALLYNQNNVAAEASPVTTLLEMAVGNDLCRMLGYAVLPLPGQTDDEEAAVRDDVIRGWGHITCDGSVANLEALWMARNLKCYPTGLQAALNASPALRPAAAFEVRRLNGTWAPLTKLTAWELLNLPADEVLGWGQRLQTDYGITPAVLTAAVQPYTVQQMGYASFCLTYLPDVKRLPVALGPATKHYSWPKGAAIVGVGAANMRAVRVDTRARLDLPDLERQLTECLHTQTPVLQVVAVIGSTEESAVDPLAGVLALRDKFRARGLDFVVHADAAWGGYFAAMLHAPQQADPGRFRALAPEIYSGLPMSQYVRQQYQALAQADSATIDPHKAGYVPYPAGGLCYRNALMRNIVAFTAPVVYHGGVDPTVGVYGVEGSKPGAAAAAVYFSHQAIRPTMAGYGRLMSACLFNAKRLYAALVCLNLEVESGFIVVPLVPIPAEAAGESPAAIARQLRFIRDRIVNVSNEQLRQDAEAYALFQELGQDQTIISYLFNRRDGAGVLNPSVAQLNALNQGLYKAFSVRPGQTDMNETRLIVTSSQFDPAIYGPAFMQHLRGRLGVQGEEATPLDFLISTIMNPFLTETARGSFIGPIVDIIASEVRQLSAASPVVSSQA